MMMPATRLHPTMPAKKGRSKSSDLEARRTRSAQLNLRVTDFAHELLQRIANKHGLSKTGALEYAIRQTARVEGVYTAAEKTL